MNSLEKRLKEVEKKKSKIVNLYLEENIDKSTYTIEFGRLRDEEFELNESLKDSRNNLFVLGDSKGWIDWEGTPLMFYPLGRI